MIVSIPLKPVASQTIDATLGQQSCRVNVYARGGQLFLDLFLGDSLVVGGVIGRNRRLVVRDAYLGFVGDLAFVDLQGVDDPSYAGLGTRWKLYYFT